jgi:hypothetical protein
MKIYMLALCLSASVLSAKKPTLPWFSERLLERPELSLSGAGKFGKLPSYDAEPKAVGEMMRRASTGRKPLLSRMPIVEPSAEVDRNMPIVAPRTDVDFRMVVVEPSVESVK